ncbi:MAG: DUF167 domain-containing protein [Candidatus Omnitrophota bacterium]
MYLEVKVIPNAKKSEVKKENKFYRIRTTFPAVDGKANKAVIVLLSEYFNVKKNEIKIIRGEKSRKKLVEITCAT